MNFWHFHLQQRKNLYHTHYWFGPRHGHLSSGDVSCTEVNMKSSIKWRDVNMTRYTFRLVLVLKIVLIKRQKQKQTNKWKWWECSFGNPLPVLTNQKSKTATATYELILRCHFWTSLFLEQFALLDLQLSLLYIILCPFSFRQ
jgi:hypothetical protein